MVRLRNLRPAIATLDIAIARTPAKKADPHYHTPEHRAWREEGMQESGGRCQDPECKAPQRVCSRLFADHVQELQDGGAPFDRANRLMRCGACHTRKTNAERARRMARPT